MEVLVKVHVKELALDVWVHVADVQVVQELVVVHVNMVVQVVVNFNII